MKSVIIFFILLPIAYIVKAQNHLNIQGAPNSTDTVALIVVNHTGGENVIGLAVYSNTDTTAGGESGIGGYFFGGERGVYGESINSIGVYGKGAQGVRGTSINGEGVSGHSTNFNGGHFTGGEGGVYGQSTHGIGVEGFSENYAGVKGNSTNSVGVVGQGARNGVLGICHDSIGILGESDNFVGVYGYSLDSIGVYANGSAADLWLEHGTIKTNSSRRWKRNIESISDPLMKLSRIRGVQFDWDEDHGGNHSLGFIAEEIAEVLPEIVYFDNNGLDAAGMDYGKITPLLVEAVNAMRREYEQEIADLRKQNDKLHARLARIEAMIEN